MISTENLIDLLAGPVAGVITIAIGAYAAFWALRIRQALFVKIYKKQALGIGTVVLFVIAIYVIFGFEILSPSVAILLVPTIWFGSLVLYYWIDSSAKAGRRTDPLTRDTLHWDLTRLVVLGSIILGIGGLATFIIVSPTGVPFLSLLGELIGIFLFLPIFAVSIVGAVLLPVVARRSGDAALHRHLMWFGAFVGVFIIGLAIQIPIHALAPQSPGVIDVAGVIETYFLYKSAKSLAPLNGLLSELG